MVGINVIICEIKLLLGCSTTELLICSRGIDRVRTAAFGCITLVEEEGTVNAALHQCWLKWGLEETAS